MRTPGQVTGLGDGDLIFFYALRCTHEHRHNFKLLWRGGWGSMNYGYSIFL